MKSLTIILTIGLFGGTMFYLGRKTAPPQAPVNSPTAPTALDQPPTAPVAVAKARPLAAVSPKPAPAASAPVVAVKDSAPIDPAMAAFNQTLGMLISTNATYREKAKIWQQLKASGQLEQALEALKNQATDNPAAPVYHMALGEGYYAKLQSVYGQADSSTVAMLALQTDKSFNDALKADPASWEAQYVKAEALSHWPDEMNKGPEVIQQLFSLIEQQESQPAQPQYAQSYVLLGDQYQKSGQTEYAEATWRLGAQKYPNDPALQSRVKGP